MLTAFSGTSKGTLMATIAKSKSTKARTLRVVIAEDDRDMRGFYSLVLPQLGHEVVGSAKNGNELIEICRRVEPDLVIADIAMPGMDGIEATEVVYKERPVAVVLVSAHHDNHLIQRAQVSHVMSYLVKPVTDADLETCLAIAVERFEQFQAVMQEAHDLRQALNDRKLIERAKGIVMQAANITEAEAFRRLQKMSWDRNIKMAEVAQSIVTAALAMNPGSNRH